MRDVSNSDGSVPGEGHGASPQVTSAGTDAGSGAGIDAGSGAGNEPGVGAEKPGVGAEKQVLAEIEEGDEVELAGPPIPRARLAGPVAVTDYKPRRIHRKEELTMAVLALVAIVMLLAIGVQADEVDKDVTAEVVAVFGDSLRNLLLIPLRFAEGLFLLISPLAVMISLARSRRFGVILEMGATAAVAGGLALLVKVFLPHLPQNFATVLSGPSGNDGVSSIAHVGLVALIAGLTIAGSGSALKPLKYSWYGVWFLLVLEVLQGNGTLTTLLLTFLFGRMVGRIARWVFGFDDNRASPAQLVDAILNVGIVPAQVHRADQVSNSGPLITWEVREESEDPSISYGDVYLPLEATEEVGASEEIIGKRDSLLPHSADRHYQLIASDGRVFDLDVLDPQRGFTTTASDLWDRFRLADASRWTAPTVKAASERTFLTSESARQAGVRNVATVALSEAGGSVVEIWEQLPETQTLMEFSEGDHEVTDSMLNDLWVQLRAAHKKGVSHRNLDKSRVRVGDEEEMWIIGWDDGDVGSSVLSRQIDSAQLLIYLALTVGPERAVASARKHFSAAQLAAVAMATQNTVVPAGLKKAGAKPALLKDLRAELAQTAHTPAEELEPFKLQRFSPKAVLITLIVVVVFVAVLGSLNFESIGEALRGANPWWLVAAFVIGLTPWLGSAMSLQAFSGVKLRLWDATLAQVAASFVGVAAPAGIGPAGVNLRFLTRQGMTMPVAVATVTLLQIYHFLTTITLLLLVVLVSGASLTGFSFNAMSIVWIAAGVLVLLGALIAIPQVRNFAWKKIQPMWVQVAPQLTRVLANPKQMVYAFFGILIVNAGFIGAFGASLAAFGGHLGVGSLSVTYLLSNTLGSVVPTPGGIGPVEAALTGGLTVAGISAAVALSTSVVFRLLTFYLQIPIGWAALKYMQKKNLV